tara:strand:- start:218 stop:673 length:456 start_codon:yes stop_codon:yes gene_type:complete
MGLMEDYARFLSGSNRIMKDTMQTAKEKLAEMSEEEKERLRKKLDKESKFLQEGLDATKTTLAIGKLGSAKNKKTKQEGQGLKDGSKPDFLDLDKDGDKTEPMKQAAKQKVKARGGVRTAINKIKRAKDGARTGVRGTGAATKGFRKAKLS